MRLAPCPGVEQTSSCLHGFVPQEVLLLDSVSTSKSPRTFKGLLSTHIMTPQLLEV